MRVSKNKISCHFITCYLIQTQMWNFPSFVVKNQQAIHHSGGIRAQDLALSKQMSYQLKHRAIPVVIEAVPIPFISRHTLRIKNIACFYPYTNVYFPPEFCVQITRCHFVWMILSPGIDKYKMIRTRPNTGSGCKVG